jgi:2-polyprenyl-3-methyl-5-hydroxy-6-metoxy-1,4-benzoquinol methylase
MSCSSYNDPRLAAVYDALNPPGADTDFFIELASDAKKSILDIGCGTGWLACDLAARGHSVTGADPSKAMLDTARRRPGADLVTWIESGAADLSLEKQFDLIIMTGHVFQVFLSDQEVRAALANLRHHLAPSGTLAFETRNESAREWETWTPSATRRTVTIPAVGNAEVHNDIRSVAGQIVTYETHCRFGSDVTVVIEDSIRFMSRAELCSFLSEAGFQAVTLYGDWDRSKLGRTSPEIIVLARRTTKFCSPACP